MQPPACANRADAIDLYRIDSLLEEKPDKRDRDFLGLLGDRDIETVSMFLQLGKVESIPFRRTDDGRVAPSFEPPRPSGPPPPVTSAEGGALDAVQKLG